MNHNSAKRIHFEINKFLKRFEINWALHSQIFADTLPALKNLYNDYKMGIVTNTSKKAAKIVLLKYQIDVFHEVVVTRENVKRLKPDSEGITTALEI